MTGAALPYPVADKGPTGQRHVVTAEIDWQVPAYPAITRAVRRFHDVFS